MVNKGLYTVTQCQLLDSINQLLYWPGTIPVPVATYMHPLN